MSRFFPPTPVIVLTLARLSIAGLMRPVLAATLTTLHTFGVNQDGASPVALLQVGNGSFYAVTLHGGLHGRGAICASRDGTSFTAIHSFSGPDGGEPLGGLIQGRDGALYGTTLNGGLSGDGTVYKLNTDGSGFAVLHSFSGSDGALPRAALLQAANGLLYGTAPSGGVGSSGTVFSLTADGTGFTIVHSFSGADGNAPWAALIQARDGLLYGTTVSGGANSNGTVFRLAADGSGFSVVHSFNNTNGNGTGDYPRVSLTEADNGMLYGTTSRGGTNDGGTIYRLAPDGTGFATLYSFGGASWTPAGPLIQAGSALYGTTSGGSSATIFRINTDGTAYTILYTFGYPAEYTSGGSLVKASDGTLYGVTSLGGANREGTVFQISLDGSGFVTRYAFSSTDGTVSGLPLLQGADGFLYGTTGGGGTYNAGTLFRINPDGSGFTVLYSFDNTDAGGYPPNAPLIQGADGFLYGTTVGGLLGGGTVFKIGTDGSGLTILCSRLFGGDPQGALVQDGKGFLYGVTYGGLGTNAGYIFKIGMDGSGLTTLHDFSDPYGTGPEGGLLLGRDGLLYGTTSGSGGGANLDGTVFKIATDGSGFAVLHNFSGPDGNGPRASLIQARNGSLYGSTNYGGAASQGTLFQINPDGTGFSTLHSFSAPGEFYPRAALLQATDGSLYGTLYGMNVNDPDGNGAIFKIAPDGSGYTSLFIFHYLSPDGSNPAAPLIQGRDGSLYGTTGGSPSTLFRLNFPIRTHLLWTHPADGAALLTSLDNLGTSTHRIYGPSPNWAPNTIADGPDGLTRLLWNRSDGVALVWTLDAQGNYLTASYGFGPYPNWSVNSLAVDQDSNIRLLWNRSDGVAQVWTVNSANQVTASDAFGPATGWSATALAVGPDNRSRLLWKRSDGVAQVWTLDLNGHLASASYGFGPYPTWSTDAFAVGPDNNARLLWKRSDGVAQVWTVNSANQVTATAGYGPYSDKHAASFTVGVDSLARLLWDYPNMGSSEVWTVGGLGNVSILPSDSPDASWAAVAITTGP